MGFTEVRVKAAVDGNAPRERVEALVSHVLRWSPVANTIDQCSHFCALRAPARWR